MVGFEAVAILPLQLLVENGLRCLRTARLSTDMRLYSLSKTTSEGYQMTHESRLESLVEYYSKVPKHCASPLLMSRDAVI